MKQLFILSLLTAVFFLPSCKKEDPASPNKNNSNTRTGLGLVAPANATSYCVLIMDLGDTLIWSNTKGDDYRGFGGVSGSSSGDLYFSSHAMKSKTVKNLWTEVSFMFQMPESHGYSNPSCDYVDSMIKVGPITQTSTSAYFSLADSTGVYWVMPYFNTNTSTTNVESVTNIPSSTGCYSLRTKITFSNLNLDTDPFCAAFHTRIVKGELQMDFNVNP